MRSVVFLAAFTASLFFLEIHAPKAVAAPSSVNLGLGFSHDLGPQGNRYTRVPSLSALWHVTSHVSVVTRVSYLHERYLDDRGHSTGIDPVRPTQPAMFHNHYLPVGVGIRLSAENTTGARGVFVEVVPAAFLTSMDFYDEGTGHGVLAGFQAGAGVRFHAFGGSHAEIGMNFYGSERANAPQESWPEPTALRGVSSYTLYAGIGLGR